MGDLRIWLVLAGIGLFAYVAFDGFRRKNRNEYKIKLEKNLPPEPPAERMRGEFDIAGVSRPRVRSLLDALPADESDSSSTPVFAAPPVRANRSAEFASDSVHAGDVANTREDVAEHIEPIFSEEVSVNSSPVIADLFGDIDPPVAKPVKEPARKSAQNRAAPKADTITSDNGNDIAVLALTVLGKNGRYFRGNDLNNCFMDHDLRFGDMDIFHRHEDAGGQGGIQFSIANAVKPGTFDPENMSEFNTPGVSLFMTVPGPRNPRTAYELMLHTAAQMAAALGGEVHDGARKPFTALSRKANEFVLSQYEERRALNR